MRAEWIATTLGCGAAELTEEAPLGEETNPEATTLSQAFASVDGGELNVNLYRHADGREFLAVEYGAGDNSFGAFFRAGSVERVAAIHDGDLTACTAL